MINILYEIKECLVQLFAITIVIFGIAFVITLAYAVIDGIIHGVH